MHQESQAFQIRTTKYFFPKKLSLCNQRHNFCILKHTEMVPVNMSELQGIHFHTAFHIFKHMAIVSVYLCAQKCLGLLLEIKVFRCMIKNCLIINTTNSKIGLHIITRIQLLWKKDAYFLQPLGFFLIS